MGRNIIYLFLVEVLIVASCSCSSGQHKQSLTAVKADITLTAVIGGYNYLDTANTIYLNCTINNPTKDTISFITVSCGEEEFFKVSDPNFYVISEHFCFSTIVFTFRLPPGFKTDYYIKVRHQVKYEFKRTERFKVGMYILKPKLSNYENISLLYNELDEFRKVKNDSAVIWSNDIDLSRLNHSIY